MASKKLLCIEITTQRHVWNRCLFVDSVPPTSDFEFYYRNLMGFTDAVITVSEEEVPAEFNTALLNLEDAAPTAFPANDLETDTGETEKRKHYRDFLRQMCEMERSRAALRFFTKPASPQSATAAAPTNEISEEGVIRVNARRKRAWVEEILQSINPDAAYEETALTVSNADKVAAAYGWIITPTLQSERKGRGSRLIINTAVGEKWESMLGTYLFPDLIVSRRISSASWAFQHILSDNLVRSILDWYIASQDVQMCDGVSDYIIGAERELGYLLSMFRKVRVNEKFLTEDAANDRSKAVYKLLSSVESNLLGSSSEDALIIPISESAFTRYMHYLFRGSGIPKDLWEDDEGVKQIIKRWVRSGLGFRGGVDPLLSSWAEMWNLIMRGKPTAHKVNHFLATLDCWDPLSAATLNVTEKAAIAQEWVRIYIDTQLSADPKGKVKSVILHDQVKRWSLKYVPVSVFTTQFSPMSIGPVFTMRGLSSKKEKDGRFTHGIKFNNLMAEVGTDEKTVGEMMEAEAEANVVETNTVQYSEITEDGTKSKKKTVTQSIVAESDGRRIEHFFAASVTHTSSDGGDTIHLGNL